MRMSQDVILKISLRFYRKKREIISVSSVSIFLSSAQQDLRINHGGTVKNLPEANRLSVSEP